MIILRAMLVAAYRELNSRKLFWITLAISGLVVLFYASIGFNESGMSIFFGVKSVENEFVAKGSPGASMLYRSIFSSVMVSMWLAWIATILALISTTTVFPDFIAGGAIDLVLSKPIGRVHLFINKYLSSLLFVLLQVTLFCIGVFICVGWRLGEWEWKILLAIPIVTLFYSYLYSVNVLVGVVTRSALTALLVTMLFWFSLFGINFSEALLNQFRTDALVQVEEQDVVIERLESTLANTPPDADPAGAARLETQLDRFRADRTQAQDVYEQLNGWRAPARVAQLILPKTNETIALLDRWLKKDTDVNIMDMLSGSATLDQSGQMQTTDTSRSREVARRLEAEYEDRSLWYVIGTSLIFELVVLSLACFVFVRRDY